MPAWFIRCLVAVAWSSLGAFAHAKELQRWDALPAFDPLHLDGAYAGTRVCPMCRHGYDAGVVLFLPHDLDIALATRYANALQVAQRGVRDARFRVFVVFTGGVPDPARRRAVASPDPTWFVAQLDGEAMRAAREDFLGLLDHGVGAFLFVQRRLLRRYAEHELLGSSLRTDARDALRLLRELHPTSVASSSPDTPQGQLWLAPDRPGHGLLDVANERFCGLGSGGEAMAEALVAMRREGEARVEWRRSDAHGCIGLPRDGADSLALEVRLPHRDTRSLVLIASGAVAREPVVGGPCEGCDAVFDARPNWLASQARIASPGSAGEAMRIDGRVVDAQGRGVAGVQVYAYQTDASGHYPPGAATLGVSARRHGVMRQWAVTDADGDYRFDTIRPGGYPGRPDPAHVHLHVIEPGRCTYFIDDLIFDDDPRVDLARERARVDARGGSGLSSPARDASGTWRVRRDIVLGRNVPDYFACARQRALTASESPPG